MRYYRADPELRLGEVRAWGGHLERAGWTRTRGDNWHLFLARGRPPDSFFGCLEPDQWVNRLPGMAAYAVKSSLLENLRSARSRVREREGEGRWERFDFHPETYLVPEEYDAWREACGQRPDRAWISKPRASSRGRGIAPVVDPETIPQGPDWMVQEYLEPHLLDGYKYGLRFYLLVSSLDPLVVWVHERGTCRLATRPFSEGGAGGRWDPLVHLINTAVQQSNADIPWWQRNLDLVGYYDRMSGDGVDVPELRKEIRDALTRTLIACRDQALVESRRVTTRLEGCFEFLGVDVQVDAAIRPWILECNPAPPMEDEGGFDAVSGALFGGIKDSLMADTLALLGLAGGAAKEAGSYRGGDRLLRERDRSGGWSLLWPAEDAGRFVADFPLLRPRDRALAVEAGTGIVAGGPRLAPAEGVSTYRLAGGLAVHDDRSGRVFALDPFASYLWLGLGEGLEVEELLDEVEGETGPGVAGWRDRVWDLVVSWAQRGLLAGFELRQSRSPRPGLIVSGVEVPGGLLVVPPEAVVSGQRPVRQKLPWGTAERLIVVRFGCVELPSVRQIEPSATLDHLGREQGGALCLSSGQAEQLIPWIDDVALYEISWPEPIEPGSWDRIWHWTVDAGDSVFRAGRMASPWRSDPKIPVDESS